MASYVECLLMSLLILTWVFQALCSFCVCGTFIASGLASLFEDMCIVLYSSNFGLLFQFLNFWCIKVPLWWGSFYFFPFTVVLFVSYIWNPCLPWSCEYVLLGFLPRSFMISAYNAFLFTVWGSIWGSSLPWSCWSRSSALLVERLLFTLRYPGSWWGSVSRISVMLCNLLFILMPVPHCIDYGGFISVELQVV